jgi:hypothetical protein
MPAELRALEPHDVCFDDRDGTVRISFGGGFIYAYGYIAFPDDTPRPLTEKRMKMLIPGLYSFNDN